MAPADSTRTLRKDNFPLWLHQLSGYWCRKIGGKRHYFAKDKKLRRLDRRSDLDADSMRQMVECWKQFAGLAGQFGLSPSARTRIRSPEQPDRPADPLAKMIAMRADNPRPGA